MKKFLTSSSIAAFCAVFAGAAAAKDVRYFSSDEIICRNRLVDLEVRYAPDADPALTVMWKDDRGRFTGLEWSLDTPIGSGPLMLDRIARLDRAEIRGLETDAPEVAFYDRRSPPNPLDCPVLALEPADPPQERYAAAGSLLDVDPAPAAVATAAAAMKRLPPSAFLAALDQQTIPGELNSRFDAFEAEMLAQVEGRIAELDVEPSAALVEEFRGYWIQDRNVEATGMMLRLQRAYAAKTMLSGGEVVLARLGGGLFCEALLGNPGYLPTNDYLELMSGVPLALWSRDMAEELMSEARTCGDEQFEKTVISNWPSIERRIATLAILQNEVQRLAALEKTLAGIAASSWLASDIQALRQAGVEQQDIEAILATARDQIMASAVPAVAQELTAELEQMEVSQHFIDHCTNAVRSLAMSASPLSGQAGVDAAGVQQDIENACELRAAELLATRGAEQIEADRAAALDAPVTGQGARETHGFGSSVNYDGLQSMEPFASVIENLQAEAAALRAETAAKRAEAAAGASEDMAAQFADDRDASGQINCLEDYGWSEDLLRECQMLAQQANARAAELACDAKFDAVDAPDELRNGQIQFGLYGSGSIRDAVCGAHGDFSLERAGGGLFSSAYHVLHIRLPEGQRFSARLLEPETGDVWRWTDAEIVPGRVRDDRDLNEPSVLAHCINNLATCLE